MLRCMRSDAEREGDGTGPAGGVATSQRTASAGLNDLPGRGVRQVASGRFAAHRDRLWPLHLTERAVCLCVSHACRWFAAICTNCIQLHATWCSRNLNKHFVKGKTHNHQNDEECQCERVSCTLQLRYYRLLTQDLRMNFFCL